jgi:hypothetical protein
LVIGSYSDREAGEAALRAPRRAGFRRAAAVHGLSGSRVEVEGFGLTLRNATLIGTAIGLIVALLLVVPGSPVGVETQLEWLALGIVPIVLGAGLGAAVGIWVAPAIRPATIAQFRRWVTSEVAGVYGARIPGTSRYQIVGVDNLKPGDIFTFWAKDSYGVKYISHVALYIGKINGKPAIINTRKDRPTALGIVTDFSYWYGSNLNDVRRVLPSDAYVSGGAAINDKGPVIPAVYQMSKGTVIMPQNLAKGF